MGLSTTIPKLNEAPDSISIIIVNYRTAKLVIDTLASLAPEIAATSCCRCIVVDNQSPDDSLTVISQAIKRHNWSAWAQVVAAPSNAGFGSGNNFGVSLCPPLSERPASELVWFLNPDTIVQPGCLGTVGNFFADNPQVGILGTRLLSADRTSIDRSAHLDVSPLSELDSAAQTGPITELVTKLRGPPPSLTEPSRCDWVSGASLFIRRDVFMQSGGFDPSFFLYFEEVDLCRTVRRLGWEIWHLPSAEVVHLEGESTGIRTISKPRPTYWFDSRRRYLLKGGGVRRLILADVCWLAGYAIRLVRQTIRPASRRQLPPRFVRMLLLNDLLAVLRPTDRKAGAQ